MAKKAQVKTEAVQGTLQLPYAEITEVASRSMVRELISTKKAATGRDSYFLLQSIIKIRPGYNIRIKPDHMTEEEWESDMEIPELAMDLLENGLATPLEGDLTKDCKIFWLTDGERRSRAIAWLLRNDHKKYNNGREIKMVEVFLNKAGTTEEERLLRMLNTDSKKKYNAIETGHGFLRLKEHFQYSNDKIAKRRGNISRQTVDNWIKLAQEPKIIQDAIITGKLSTTAAIELLNNEKDPEKRIAIVTGAVEGGTSLKVKEVSKPSKYKDYNGLLAGVVERYDEELINYSKAIEEATEIAKNARIAVPDDMDDINTELENTLEVLKNKSTAKKTPAAPAVEAPLTPGTEEEDEAPEYYNTFNKICSEYIEGILDFATAEKNLEEAAETAYDEYDSSEHPNIKIQCEFGYTKLLELKKLKDQQKVKKVDTDAANKVEEASHQTSAAPVDPSRKKGQGADALDPIDFTKDKEMGEMELNEAVKMLDKLRTKLDLFPKHLQTYIDDCQGLVVFIQGKINAGIEVIKKAGNTR